jgi:serine protease Do
LSTNFTRIAKEVSPAVVNISTESVPKHTQQSQQMGPGGDNGMQQFFQHFFGMNPGMGQPNQDNQVREALGSGFIVDPHGYILTNYHVIHGATSILVKLKSDPEGFTGHPATVVGFDKATDLAVIKINVGHALPTVQMGNSSSMQVGDQVIAIGAPLGLTETVTAGIISAKNRTIDPTAAGQFKHYLQTDAAINPGNSGGPLVNMKGQVIGINTAIYTETGGFQGMGFAMPSNTVINVYNQLIGPEHKVIRGSLGIQFRENLPPAVAHVYGFSSGGVMISSVVPGTPAEKAGLKNGDIITSVNGQHVKDGNDLVDIITAKKPGSSVTLGYIDSNGKHQTAQVGIISRSELEKLLKNAASNSSSSSNGPGMTGHVKLGITVSDLPQGAPAGLHGVLIQSVQPGSFADLQLGLAGAQGMVITAINRHPVNNVAEFRAIVAGLKPGDDVALQLINPQDPTGGSNYVGGTLP